MRFRVRAWDFAFSVQLGTEVREPSDVRGLKHIWVSQELEVPV